MADHDRSVHHDVGLVELGSGRLQLLGVGAKASLVDRAARAGLAVPLGVVLLDGAPAPAAADLPAELRAPDHGLAVRSAFFLEDGRTESHAGRFRSLLRVGPDGITEAVADVRASADADSPGSMRRDVLIMDMVDARHAGVAFSEPGWYDDLVNVTTGTAEHLVAGDEPGERVELPRLEHPDGAPWQHRLQRVLRRVRREFGDLPWDVEWADDGSTCWLVQLRPATRPARRDETLTIVNHAEILPPLPSTLMTSVIAGAGDELFAWYRRADPTLPANRPFLEVVAGRPFINLTLLEDLMRHLGLPTRLVADSIGGPPRQDRPLRPTRVLRSAPALGRLAMAQVDAVARRRAHQRRAAEAGAGAERLDRFADVLDQLHDAYVGLVTSMFPLSSAIGPPLALLRRSGTLAEHATWHRSITTELAEVDGAALRSGPGSPAWAELLERFGHRGVYESDIARPRYRDEPSMLGPRARTTTGRFPGAAEADLARGRHHAGLVARPAAARRAGTAAPRGDARLRGAPRRVGTTRGHRLATPAA